MGLKERLVIIVMAPVIAAAYLLFCWEVVASARAAMGFGTPGTVVITESCRRYCDWKADFIPHDGGSPRRDVDFSKPLPSDAGPGDRFPALDSGGLMAVHSSDGSWRPGWPLGGVLFGSMLLALAGYRFVKWRKGEEADFFS
ncbi:hypothetical protein [Rhizohabitans arisaemae]|uniref:hypothetical protein n=1 Tax=Rhizohabitans arisaemae TaxID=2720610 RepID=UPI0024B1854E|nr:hypothetical protein [Rhizohabitans arisaemae]